MTELVKLIMLLFDMFTIIILATTAILFAAGEIPAPIMYAVFSLSATLSLIACVAALKNIANAILQRHQ